MVSVVGRGELGLSFIDRIFIEDQGRRSGYLLNLTLLQFLPVSTTPAAVETATMSMMSQTRASFTSGLSDVGVGGVRWRFPACFTFTG